MKEKKTTRLYRAIKYKDRLTGSTKRLSHRLLTLRRCAEELLKSYFSWFTYHLGTMGAPHCSRVRTRSQSPSHHPSHGAGQAWGSPSTGHQKPHWGWGHTKKRKLLRGTTAFKYVQHSSKEENDKLFSMHKKNDGLEC